MISPIKIYLFRDLASQAISKFIDLHIQNSTDVEYPIEIPLPSTNKLKRILRDYISTLPIEMGRSKTIIVNTCVPILNSRIHIDDVDNVEDSWKSYKFSINSDQYIIDGMKLNNILEQIFSNYAKYPSGTQREFNNKTIQCVQTETYSAKTVIKTLYDKVISKSLTELIVQHPHTQLLIDNNGRFPDNNEEVYINGNDYTLLQSAIH